jgi:hypothetical protein
MDCGYFVLRGHLQFVPFNFTPSIIISPLPQGQSDLFVSVITENKDIP